MKTSVEQKERGKLLYCGKSIVSNLSIVALEGSVLETSIHTRIMPRTSYMETLEPLIHCGLVRFVHCACVSNIYTCVTVYYLSPADSVQFVDCQVVSHS